MGTRSNWHTAVVNGAVEVFDPQGQSHLRITDTTSSGKAGWNPDRKGRITRDGPCLIETPWGESVTSKTAKDTPFRRVSARREVTLGGRHYRYLPTSDRRSVVERDGQQIATLHKNWQHVWNGRRPSFADLGFTMEVAGPLDPLDEAMIVGFGAVIGTPGHEGGFSTGCRVGPLLVLAGIFS